jgi:protein inturned
VEDQLIHVGYAEERDDLFIMALPALKASAKEVSQLVRDTVRVLRLRHKTLARAFSQKNTADLNEFFSVLFLDTLLGKLTSTTLASGASFSVTTMPSPLLDTSAVLAAPGPARFDQSLPAAQWLHLPDDVKFQIDDALSQLEAADFTEYSEDFYDAPREFNILGACLFHRGRLLASHLTRDDLIDVLLWCQFNQILPLTSAQPVQQAGLPTP